MPIPDLKPAIAEGRLLARFPFLPQASPWIAGLANKHGIDLDTLLEGPSMEKARLRARQRLLESLEKDKSSQSNNDVWTEDGQIIEAFAFYYARLVICASEDEKLIARWAQTEAERAEKMLVSNKGIAFDEQHLDLIARTYFTKIKSEDSFNSSSTRQGLSSMKSTGSLMMNLNQVEQGKTWNIGLSDYIEVCPKITGDRWRLPNTDIKDGWIKLHHESEYNSSKKLARLMRERFKQEIEKDALSRVNDVTTELAIRLAEPVGMLRSQMSKIQKDAIELVGASQEEWPPCMKNVVAQLTQGVNVNHFGRVFMASMASTLALPQEACVDFFRGAPDFSEQTTAYQVAHIYDREYTPSGCGKLKVNHNCPVLPGDDRICDIEWMNHPLKYIRVKQRSNSMRRKVEQKTISDTDDGESHND